MKKVICHLALLLPWVSAWGFDAYFYNSASNTPLLSAPGASSVLFGQQATIVTLSDFTQQELDTRRLDYMLLRDKTTSNINTAVAGPSSAAPTLRMEGEILTVESRGIVGCVRIYALNGAVVSALQSKSSKVTLDLSNISTGVYVVQVVTGGTLHTAKIMK